MVSNVQKRVMKKLVISTRKRHLLVAVIVISESTQFQSCNFQRLILFK